MWEVQWMSSTFRLAHFFYRNKDDLCGYNFFYVNFQYTCTCIHMYMIIISPHVERHGVTWLNYWYIYLIKTPFVICLKCLFVAPEKSTENSLPQIIIIPQWLWLNKEIRTCNKCAEPITRLTLYYNNINVLFLFKNE